MLRRLTLVLAAVCLAMAGCSPSMEVENQAYVLVMGLDEAGGGLEVTVRVPKIGQSEIKDGGKSGGSSYLTFAARGNSFARCVDELQKLAPRELNLSHIMLVVASAELAERADFGDLVNAVAETPHLYTTARFAVCEGRAADFVAGMSNVIGTRLSAEITAMFDHYALRGFVPDSTLAELYYASNSVYSDPSAAVGIPDGEGESGGSDAETDAAGAENEKTPSRQIYSGAAVFREGVLALRLDADEAFLLSLAQGRVKTFLYDTGGAPCRIMRHSRPGREAAEASGRLVVSLDIDLTTVDPISEETARRIERELTQKLLDLIARCQAAGVDPFGFAERAARRFATIPEWLAYGWRNRFSGAETRVRVCLDCLDAS